MSRIRSLEGTSADESEDSSSDCKRVHNSPRSSPGQPTEPVQRKTRGSFRVVHFIMIAVLFAIGLHLNALRYRAHPVNNPYGFSTKDSNIPKTSDQLKAIYVDRCCYGDVCLLNGDCYMPLRDWLDLGMTKLYDHVVHRKDGLSYVSHRIICKTQ